MDFVNSLQAAADMKPFGRWLVEYGIVLDFMDFETEEEARRAMLTPMSEREFKAGLERVLEAESD